MRPRGGKPRKSRRTKIASPGAAERHQGRLPPREDLGTVASPPQSDLRATDVAWQPGVERLGTWPQSTPSSAAHCARARTQRAPSQRDHNAPSTLPSVEHLRAQARWQVEAWATGRWRTALMPGERILAWRAVAPHLQRADTNLSARGRNLSAFERGFWFSKPSAPAAGRAGTPERSAGSSRHGLAEDRAGHGGAHGRAEVRVRPIRTGAAGRAAAAPSAAGLTRASLNDRGFP